MNTPVSVRLATFIGSALALCNLVIAAEPRTEHTFKLEAGEERPSATLQDASLLVGSWTGTAFGSRFEEVWNPPSAGSMVGMYKVYDGNEVSFYELMLITEESGSLKLKVKHFNADFSAWEEKEEFVTFELVKFSENELHFSGLSFYKRNDDLMDGYIVMKNGEDISEHQLVYERQ